MRFFQTWWRVFVFASQHNPPWFIELLMTFLAVILLGVWGLTHHWAYLVLSSSYAIGAAASLWVRESFNPHSSTLRVNQVLAVLLLIYGFCGFADLFQIIHR